MKVMYVLNSNIASYIIKGNIPSIDRWLARVPVEDVFISAVTEAELRYGVARRPDATRLETLVEDFLLTVTILLWDSGGQTIWMASRDTRTRTAANG
jgi:tRNA(fMet)-specific endonuclease VapC